MAKRKRGRPKSKPKVVLVCKITGEIMLNGEEDFHMIQDLQAILENIRTYGTANLEFEARKG